MSDVLLSSEMIQRRLNELFPPEQLMAHPDEWGVRVSEPGRPLRIAGYVATLTPEMLRAAISAGADLLVTHHDCWKFLFELRQECAQLLEQSGLAHVFVHLPLDECEFGTVAALLQAAGCTHPQPFFEEDGFVIGRGGELDRPTPLDEIAARLSSTLAEEPRWASDSGKPIRCLACITGAGGSTLYLQAAIQQGYDLFITGEYNAYFGMYARQRGISALVYTHTYSERPGAANLAARLCAPWPQVQVVGLDEVHD